MGIRRRELPCEYGLFLGAFWLFLRSYRRGWWGLRFGMDGLMIMVNNRFDVHNSIVIMPLNN